MKGRKAAWNRLTSRPKAAAPDRRFMAEWRRVKNAKVPKAAVRATRM